MGGLLTDGTLSGIGGILRIYKQEAQQAIKRGERGIGKTDNAPWIRWHERFGWKTANFAECMANPVWRNDLIAYIQASPKGWSYYENGNFTYTLLGT